MLYELTHYVPKEKSSGWIPLTTIVRRTKTPDGEHYFNHAAKRNVISPEEFERMEKAGEIVPVNPPIPFTQKNLWMSAAGEIFISNDPVYGEKQRIHI